MAIVTLQIPITASQVSYGRAKLQPEQDGTMQVPGYVAKTLLTLPGVTGPAQIETAAALLAATEDEFECNYLFWANGQSLPDSDKLTAANALMIARGEPVASLA